MNRYLEGEPVTEKEIRTLVRSREVFPCYFGSALKVQGGGGAAAGHGAIHGAPPLSGSFRSQNF